MTNAAEPAVTLFDGKSMAGWHQAGPGGFEIKDGCLVAHGGMGLLWNDHEFGDFDLKCQFKVTKPRDNSGVFVRFPDPGKDPWVAVKQGHEIQICDTEKGHQTGAIYNFQNCSTLNSKPAGEWNDYDIKVVGHHYTVTLNGKVVNEFTTARKLLKGYIGLQNHGAVVSFRNVVVTPLTDAASTVPVAAPAAVADPQPGVVGRYVEAVRTLRDLQSGKADPFFVRVDKQINFPAVAGDFYGSHLTDRFGVRWAGSIHIDRPGLYAFALQSDDQSVLLIDGKKIIDHTAKHDSMKDKAGEIRFDAAGDFPLQVDFHQDGAQSGCILSWQPPGVDHMATLPGNVLVHARADEAVKWDKESFDLFASNHRAWMKLHGANYEKMEYGPFLSGTFESPTGMGNTTLKGIIVSLDKDQTTNVMFDTESLRYSTGWTGDFIDFHGVAYNGNHVDTPKALGTEIFSTPVMPGWADRSGSFKDPRSKPVETVKGIPNPPVGNLPRAWAHYRGLYRSGDTVVFTYEVNGVGVLDTPGTAKVRDRTAFTRTLQVDPSPTPLTLVVADVGKGVDYLGTEGVTFKTDNQHRLLATLPPHNAVAQYSIEVWSNNPPLPWAARAKTLKGPEVDFAALLKGGPRLWGEPIVMQGHLGDDKGAYSVDTITLPDNTPYHAWMRTSGFDFFPDGHSAALCTWNGDVWVVKGIDDSLSHLTWQRYATGLFQTLGLKIVNSEIYVLGRDQITRLHDLNGDGEADWYENFNNDCIVGPGYHEFEHDLHTDKAGNFYFAKGGSVTGGGRGFQYLTPDNGCILKVTPDGKTMSVFATGLRAPNGMSLNPVTGQMTVSDNQGTWVPACRINFVTPGSFMGVPDTSHRTPVPTNYGDPICWFPYVNGDYTTGDNSSGGAAWDTTGKWGPMDGKLIHLSYGTCSIFETMFEQVDGLWQGGVVRFPLDFDSGIMRARFNPVDGQLYVSGLKGWQSRAARDGIFQRVRYTGKPVHMPSELHVHAHDITIGFTDPLDKTSATDVDNFDLQQWNYVWAEDYGSPEVSRDNPRKKGRGDVDVSSITLSPDGKTLTLHISDLKPVMQMKIQMKIKAADGSPMNWEIDNTLNAVPGQKPIAVAQP